jgi:hypothetical protein
LDCLQVKFGGCNAWFDGVGIIKDDTPEHVTITMVESRPKGHYGGLDVGTWLYITKVG